MSGCQIDMLCRDWLHENYGKEMASQYTIYSLVMPQWNSAELSEALEALRLVLCHAFGPEQSFGNTDYYRAREKLGLPGDTILIPDVFIRAFATN